MSVPRKRHQLTARRAGSAGIINRTALGGRPARLRAGRRGCEPHCAVASIVASAPGATGGEGPVAAVTGDWQWQWHRCRGEGPVVRRQPVRPDHVAEAGARIGGQYARSIARSVSGVVDCAARRCTLMTCMYGVRIQDGARLTLPKARLTTAASADPPGRSVGDLGFREVRW
jgi:hypothetical protein